MIEARLDDQTPPKRQNPSFVTPMAAVSVDPLPEGPEWSYELKLDGYRAIAFKTGGKLHLRSRNDNDFGVRYSGVLRGLAKLPNVEFVKVSGHAGVSEIDIERADCARVAGSDHEPRGPLVVTTDPRPAAQLLLEPVQPE